LKKTWKKNIAILLVVVMALTIMPVTVFAEGASENTTEKQTGSITIGSTETKGLFNVTAQFTTAGNVQWIVSDNTMESADTIYNEERSRYEAVLENITLKNGDTVSATLENEFGDYITVSTVAEIEDETNTQDEIEKELHHNRNGHQTRVYFYDENGKEISTRILHSSSRWVSKPTSSLYSTETFIDDKGKVHSFEGWFDADGNKFTGATQKYYVEDMCAKVYITAKWRVEDPCSNLLHDNEKNQHRHGFVGIDQSEDTFHTKWYQEYGRSTWGATAGFSISGIQGFTSGELTHNDGIYYYEFLGWYDENGNKIESTWNAKNRKYNFVTKISIPASNQCEEVKIYAKWKEHCAPIVHLQYLDAIAYGSGSIENTNAKISSLSRTYTDPTVKSPNAAIGYTFRGWKDKNNDKVYQAGDTFTVDMSKYEDDTFTVITHSALWQPTLTVKFEDRFDKNKIVKIGKDTVLTGDEEKAGEYAYEFDFANLPKEYQLSKDGWEFLGWADENGNLMHEKYYKNVPDVFYSVDYAKLNENGIIESADNRYVFENVPQPEVVTFHAVWIQDGTLNVNHHYTLNTITTTYNANGTVNKVEESAETVTDTKVVSTLNGKPVMLGEIEVNNDVVNELKQETFKEQQYNFEKVDQEKVEVVPDGAATIDMHYVATVQKRIDLSPVITPSGGGNSSYDGPYSDDPTPSTPSTEIPDQDVPLAEPDVTELVDPTIEIDEPDVPLADIPGEPVVEMEELEVPLNDAPRTGDTTQAVAFAGLMMAAGFGLVITRKKFNEMK